MLVTITGGDNNPKPGRQCETYLAYSRFTVDNSEVFQATERPHGALPISWCYGLRRRRGPLQLKGGEVGPGGL